MSCVRQKMGMGILLYRVETKMTFEEFRAEAARRGLDVRESYHTESNIWSALDPAMAPKRVPRGRWLAGTGTFFSNEENEEE